MTARRRVLAARRAQSPERKPAAAALIGAIASPVVIFYAAGYLLSFGYFFAIGPALMTAFGPNELALLGFTRMAGTVTILALLGVIAVTCALLFAGGSGRARRTYPRWVAVLACAVAAIWCAGTSWRAGFLGQSLGIAATFFMGGIAVAVAMGREARMRRAGAAWPWLMLTLLAVLGVPSLGEAGFAVASADATAQWIGIDAGGGRRRRVKLLVLGAGAMIYETAEGRRYLSGPRGETPVRLARPRAI